MDPSVCASTESPRLILPFHRIDHFASHTEKSRIGVISEAVLNVETLTFPHAICRLSPLSRKKSTKTTSKCVEAGYTSIS